MYRDSSAADVDLAVSEMMGHHGSECQVETCDRPQKMVFGWKCACGAEWTFRLLPMISNVLIESKIIGETESQ